MKKFIILLVAFGIGVFLVNRVNANYDHVEECTEGCVDYAQVCPDGYEENEGHWWEEKDCRKWDRWHYVFAHYENGECLEYNQCPTPTPTATPTEEPTATPSASPSSSPTPTEEPTPPTEQPNPVNPEQAPPAWSDRCYGHENEYGWDCPTGITLPDEGVQPLGPQK